MTKLLFIDTETGGLDPSKHSLLSIALGVWEAGEITASLELQLVHPEYNVTNKAMEINNIDLRQPREGHNKGEAYFAIESFLMAHMDTDEKPTLVGQNVGFDIGFLKEAFGPRAYGKLFSHRAIDTASIIRFLQTSGQLDMVGASLEAAIHYYELPVQKKDRHTALGDVYATALLYNQLLLTSRFQVGRQVLS